MVTKQKLNDTEKKRIKKTGLIVFGFRVRRMATSQPYHTGQIEWEEASGKEGEKMN